MEEVDDQSVDLVVAGPPYNIGTRYGSNPDSAPHSEYVHMLRQVFKECERILRPGGSLVVECADTMYANGSYIALSGLIQQFFEGTSLVLVNRDVSFTLTQAGIELPEHGWDPHFTAHGNAHSNCHQILVFEKGSGTFSKKSGQILYYDYPSNEEGHPCPFSEEFISLMLDWYFRPGMVVLDPFMGTGRLGRQVLQRGGTFYGYDTELEFCQTAEASFQKILREN